MQFLSKQVHHLAQALDPRRSLRIRITITFVSLAVLLTLSQVIFLELTATDAVISPALLNAQLKQQIWVSGLLLTVVFITIAWIIIGRIARPLRSITEAARALQEHGQEHVIPTFPGQDEVASLSRSLNILVANLKTQQKALREANDRLEQHVALRTHQLTTLYDVLEISSGIEALPKLLERALTRIVQESYAGLGFIHLVDKEEEQLRLVAHYQGSQTSMADSSLFSLTNPIVQKALQQEAFLLMADLPVATFGPTLAGYHQALFLPIRNSDESLGLLTVFTNETYLFDEDEIALLTSLADQLSITIENARLRQKVEQLAIVEERNRLARELHDSVTQSLYSTALFAEAGQKQAQKGNLEKAVSYLDEVLKNSRQALKEMRLLVHKLRPSTLEKEGLVFALDQRLKAVEARAGIESKLSVPEECTLPADIEETLYHIAVEALNNSLKHTRSTAVSVTIAQTETAVSLQISDNGQGFELKTAVASGGLGLISMQERAAQQKGTLTIEAKPGAGTTITAVLPLTS